MNNFTKEELQLMSDLISEFFYSRKEPNDVYLLRNKIESMIDKYCEHHKVTIIGEKETYSQCLKCGVGLKN